MIFVATVQKRCESHWCDGDEAGVVVWVHTRLEESHVLVSRAVVVFDNVVTFALGLVLQTNQLGSIFGEKWTWYIVSCEIMRERRDCMKRGAKILTSWPRTDCRVRLMPDFSVMESFLIHTSGLKNWPQPVGGRKLDTLTWNWWWRSFKVDDAGFEGRKQFSF